MATTERLTPSTDSISVATSADLDSTALNATEGDGFSTAPPIDSPPVADSKSLGDAAARGAGVTLAAQAVRFVLQFGSLVVLARLLTPDDFGTVAMVTAITGIAEILRDFGLSSAAVQAKTLSDDERTNLFWVNVGIGAFCAIGLAACAPLIQRLYGNSHLMPIVFVLAGVFIVSGANTQFGAELSRNLRFGALAAADIAAQAIGIALAITLCVLGAGFWAIVCQQIAVAVFTMTFNVRVCRWRPTWYRRSVKIGRFFRFSGGVFGTQLISYMTKNIDNVGVGAVWGAQSLGLYSRAYQLLMQPLNQINAPLTRVALPILSKVQDDDVVYQRFLRKAQLVACYLTATLFAMCTAFAWPITEVLFGHRWIGVAPIFALLAAGGVFRSISQISYWCYLSRGKTLAQLKLYMYTRPIMIGIILAGLPWGPAGVACGCSIAYFGYWVASLWHVGRATGVDSWALFTNAMHAVLLVSAPCGVCAWAGTLVVHEPFAQLALGTVLAVAYLVVLIWLAPSVRADAGMMRSFLSRSIGVGARRRSTKNMVEVAAAPSAGSAAVTGPVATARPASGQPVTVPAGGRRRADAGRSSLGRRVRTDKRALVAQMRSVSTQLEAGMWLLTRNGYAHRLGTVPIAASRRWSGGIVASPLKVVAIRLVLMLGRPVLVRLRNPAGSDGHFRAQHVLRAKSGGLILFDRKASLVVRTDDVPSSDTQRRRAELGDSYPVTASHLTQGGAAVQETLAAGDMLVDLPVGKRLRVLHDVLRRTHTHVLAHTPTAVRTSAELVDSAFAEVLATLSADDSLAIYLRSCRSRLVAASAHWPLTPSHGDLTGLNIIVDKNRWTLIDFEDVDDLPYFYDGWSAVLTDAQLADDSRLRHLLADIAEAGGEHDPRNVDGQGLATALIAAARHAQRHGGDAAKTFRKLRPRPARPSALETLEAILGGHE